MVLEALLHSPPLNSLRFDSKPDFSPETPRGGVSACLGPVCCGYPPPAMPCVYKEPMHFEKKHSLQGEVQVFGRLPAAPPLASWSRRRLEAWKSGTAWSLDGDP